MMSNLAEATTGEVVAIAIGPNKKVFRLHKDILCSESEYFCTAYNGLWKEAVEGVTLEDVEVEVFSIFVHWLYTQQMPTYEDNRKYDISEDFGFMLLKAYVFANRFLIADFERIVHNLLIDHMVDFGCSMYEHIIFAYENLPEDSLVLKLMVEMQCLRWELDFDGDEEKQRRLDLPKAFLVQVMVRLVELRDRNIALQDRDIGIEEFNAGDFYMQEESEEAGE
ncbi:unnamed protein product [Alternaria alternata]|uniref:BTB domain-containing protein n=1 Tax=Alternaria alternata TaxID=5599 RepID=A0A4Q4NHS6_ALTAL|nr:hypothetical protein AA0117_g5611 [Alternaria alternata]